MITKQQISTAQSLAPLLSEGAISPFQVSNMSKREKATREKNIQIRYNLEYEYKRQNMTVEEEAKEKQEEIKKEIKNLEIKIRSKKRTIAYCEELPAFKSNRMNNTRRAVLIEEDEIRKEELKIKELQGRLK